MLINCSESSGIITCLFTLYSAMKTGPYKLDLTIENNTIIHIQV